MGPSNRPGVAVPLREFNFRRLSGEPGRDKSIESLVGLNRIVLDEVLRACAGLFFLFGDIGRPPASLLPDADNALAGVRAGVRAGVLGLVTIGVRKNSSSDVA